MARRVHIALITSCLGGLFCPAVWAQTPTLVVSGSGSISYDFTGSYYGDHRSTSFVLNAANPSVPPAYNFNVTGSFGSTAATISMQGNAVFGHTPFNGCPYSLCTWVYGAGATLNISLQGTAGTAYAIDITRTASMSAATADPIGAYSARADSTSADSKLGPPSASFSTVTTVHGTGSITTAVSLGGGVGFRQAYCRASDSQGCLGDSVGYPGGGAGTVAYTVTIVARLNSQPPLSLSCPASAGAVNAPYTSAFAASGGTGTYSSYGIATGSLPPGLSLNSVGGVSGTPTTAGTFSFRGAVTDSAGAGATSPSCSITVAAPPPLTLSCPAGSAMANSPYASAFVAFGGTGTFTSYGIATGSLPPGLTLNSVGGVSGSPTTAGPSSFTGRVTDSAGAVATSPVCNITVAPSCTYSLSYPSRNFPKVGGPAAVEVTASDISCPIYSSSPVDWVMFSGPQPRYGSGPVYYSVASNSGPKRETSVTVAQQPLAITQDGNDTCNDERDQIIQQYRDYHADFVPTCSDFTQNPQPAPHFSFAELKSPDASWAILRGSLLGGLESIRSGVGNVAISIHSAYRTPAHNGEPSIGGAVGSRHIHGDAVDMSSGYVTLDALRRAAKAAGACVEPEDRTPSWAHADWRGSCPAGW